MAPLAVRFLFIPRAASADYLRFYGCFRSSYIRQTRLSVISGKDRRRRRLPICIRPRRGGPARFMAALDASDGSRRMRLAVLLCPSRSGNFFRQKRNAVEIGFSPPRRGVSFGSIGSGSDGAVFMAYPPLFPDIRGAADAISLPFYGGSSGIYQRRAGCKYLRRHLRQDFSDLLRFPSFF